MNLGRFANLTILSLPIHEHNILPCGFSQSVQSLSKVRLFGTPWTATRLAALFITNSRSLLKVMSIRSVMPSNYLILCRPLLLLPSIFPRTKVFSNAFKSAFICLIIFFSFQDKIPAFFLRFTLNYFIFWSLGK